MKQNFTKMPFVYYLQIFQIHHLATLLPGRLSHRVARYGFVNKKMAFLKNFVQQQLLFLFPNIWIQCRIWHILSMVTQTLDIPGGSMTWANLGGLGWTQADPGEPRWTRKDPDSLYAKLIKPRHSIWLACYWINIRVNLQLFVYTPNFFC